MDKFTLDLIREGVLDKVDEVLDIVKRDILDVYEEGSDQLSGALVAISKVRNSIRYELVK